MKNRGRVFVLGAAALFAVGAGVGDSFSGKALAAELSPKVSDPVRKLLGDRTGSKIPVLVLLKARADLSGADALQTKAEKGRFVYDALRKTALESQQGLVQWLTENKLVFRRHYLLNMVEIEKATAEQVEAIAARAEVARVIANPQVAPIAAPSRPLNFFDFQPFVAVIEPGIINTGAPKVWDELKVRGQGIVVASADTGVKWDHPAIIRQYRGFQGQGSVSHDYNWHDSVHAPIAPYPSTRCKPNQSVPCADGDHGTHTVGTMVGEVEVKAGESAPAHSRIGMAPAAQWISCRNMEDGWGTPASYLECNEFFLAPFKDGQDLLVDGDPARAPHVVNNSWGCPKEEGCEADLLLPAMEAMKSAGILMVVSAGNSGPNCGTIDATPAYFSNAVLRVGASDAKQGYVAFFSSRGPSKFDGGLGPDLVAPGVNVWSASSETSSGYDPKDGTSMAGPHVAGAAALLWSAKPELVGRVPETMELFRKTTAPIRVTQSCGGIEAGVFPNHVAGFGTLDVYKAITGTAKP